MKVIVTQDHIDNGKVENCRTCPIALAINSNLKTSHAIVGSRTVSVFGVTGYVTYHLPDEAKLLETIMREDQKAIIDLMKTC